MKVDLGHGASLEPDEGPRSTPFHKQIVAIEPVANTRSGNWLMLECGHRVMAFGDLQYGGGVVLCTQCRDAGARK
jgi:hypothetical protein